MTQFWETTPATALRSVTEQIGTSLKAARRGMRAWDREFRAHIRRRRSRARFIAITGSSAKTTTTALLAHILSSRFKTSSQIDQNAAINAIQAINLLDGSEEFVVIETASAGPGDLVEAMKVVKPDVAIVTMVAIEHYSAFRNIEAVADEKSEAIRALKHDGLAVLNYDDERVRAMAALTRARTVTFGGEGADYKISPSMDADGLLTLRMTRGDRVLVLQTQLIGAFNAVTVAAAACCALEMGVPEQCVVESVAKFSPYPGRMYRKAIPGGPIFIVDTRKAPYHSINLPIETLAAIQAPRKRFILGQISDYPGNPRKKYRDTYHAARAIADQVIFVGPHCHRSGATPEDVAGGRFRAFQNIQDAAAYLKETAIENEVIMVKSSRNLHLERLLLAWLTDVRCWVETCGVKTDCWSCGLYGHPFTEHGGNPRHYRPKKRGLKRLLAKLPFASAKDPRTAPRVPLTG
ncbi:MAG TPA: Mur ligase family protein [Hyphomicrobium sp.]|nr:Mur ligase family protein [Hyphomicrobium sp.]